MAQLDKIIKVMLDRTGSDIVLNTGAEPYLRVEGGSPHVLINKKLPAPHLKQLVGELIGDAAMAELDAADAGDYNYAFSGRVVTVAVRGWTGAVEARIRPGGTGKRPPVAPAGAPSLPKTATMPGTQSLPKTATSPGTQSIPKIDVPRTATGDPRRASQNYSGVTRAAEPVRGGDSLEIDLSPSMGSRGMPVAAAASDLEVDISMPSAPRVTAFPAAEPAPASYGGDHPSTPLPATPARANYDPRPTTGGDPPINALLRAMVKAGGSDLHISTGERPMIRRDGDMARLDEQVARLKGDDVMNLVRPIMPLTNLQQFESEHDTDFAYEIEGVSRFRGNVFLDRRGVGGVFRTIPSEIMSAEKLGLSTAIQNLCFLSKGMVLVTGPTGSGKSTTLSTLIDIINKSRHDHVITIEDPIEFVHQNKQCLINQRQVGAHTDSFKRALRAALREDPDVVMVGEMRDLETMAIALETAETGHLVFGTLHTTTSYSTVDRLIDSFPADRQAQIRVMLSESLKGVVSQTLCKKLGGGRIAAYEVLIVNSAISNIIREGKTFQIPSVMQTARKQGMVLLNDALYELVEKKKVDVKEAYIRSADKGNFVSQLRAGGFKLDFLQNAV